LLSSQALVGKGCLIVELAAKGSLKFTMTFFMRIRSGHLLGFVLFYLGAK